MLKQMPSFDKSLVVDVSQDYLDEFTCGICLDLYREPLVTLCCRHTYCTDCVHRWLRERNTCPNDRRPLNVATLVPAPRFVMNLIDNMRVKCGYHNNGCQEVLKRCQLAGHMADCPHNMRCKTCGFYMTTAETHDCCQHLLSDRERLNAENSRLRDMCEKSSMAGVIERARNRLNNYHMESKFTDMCDNRRRLAITVSIDAILRTDSYESMATHITHAFNGTEAYNWEQTVRWHCVVYGRSGGYSAIVSADQYFRVSFGELVIVIFGFNLV